ncbi:PD-(D/E)XK motif protein [Bacillus infantis]|uniref:PD-(D/E)XK motif protein n=1 Tax=Bacillus infantis TaxID=324767 RepID=UPI003CEB98BF
MSTIVNEESWIKVETSTPDYGKLNVHRIDYAANLILASDHVGYRHILLPLNNISEAIKDNKSRGLLVYGRDLKIDDQPISSYLDVCCIQKDNNNLFNVIANDIYYRLKEGDSPSSAVGTTLNKWRKFWLKGLKPILSDNEIKGLFGELWFMKNWLLPKGKDQLLAWHGPDGNRYDFESNNFSVEIKTTSSMAGHVHKINGLDQLDTPSNGTLFLYSLRIRSDIRSKFSLPYLISSIKNALSDNIILLSEFENKIIESGYLPEYESEYEDFCFNIVDERMYLVGEGFPRLTLNDLKNGVPQGIQNIHYDLNLNNCKRYYLCGSPEDWQMESIRY